MADLSRSLNAIDAAVTAGAVRALRNRSVAQREKAMPGVTNDEGRYANIVIVSSEARAALNIANDLEEIAAELEAETLS